MITDNPGQTPEMLPILKQAGVVDSGGQGLMQVLKGALDGLLGRTSETEVFAVSGTASPVKVETSDIDTSHIKYGYCTEFIINV